MYCKCARRLVCAASKSSRWFTARCSGLHELRNAGCVAATGASTHIA